MSDTDPQITERRHLTVERVTWHVTEFDDGRAFMLVAMMAGTQFQAHFTGEQWAEFQKLIAGQS